MEKYYPNPSDVLLVDKNCNIIATNVFFLESREEIPCPEKEENFFFTFPPEISPIVKDIIQIINTSTILDENGRDMAYRTWLSCDGWLISPLNRIKENDFLFLVKNVRNELILPPSGSICDALLKIIQDVSRIPNSYNNPGRQIQQLISSVGMVLGADLVSFLDLNFENERYSVYEQYLWSRRYGYLIGTDWEDGDERNLLQIFNTIKSNRPYFGEKSSLSGLVSRLMEQREVSSCIFIPILIKQALHGVIVLWDARSGRRWKNQEIRSLMILADLISEGVKRNRIQEKLTRSEEKFKAIIEHIGDFYFLTDKTGLLLTISPSMGTALGYVVPDDLIGEPFESLLVHKDQWPVFLSDVLLGNGVQDYEMKLSGLGGKKLTGSISCRMIYDSNGAFQGLEGIIRDISRRKQYDELLKENRWKLDQAQKIAKLGVWNYHIYNNNLRVSHEVFSLLGITDRKSILTVDDLIRAPAESERSKLKSIFSEVIPLGNEFDIEFRINLERGAFKYLRVKGQPIIQSGIIKGSFGIIQDITERKEVEKHLVKYAEELEKKTIELDALRTQLLDMNRELDSRIRGRVQQIEVLLNQKDEFIMQIGHDLKTPLTPLVAILPFIRKKISDPEIADLLDMTIQDVQTIKNLINSVLDLARMNALYTVSDVQKINIHGVIDAVIKDNAYLIHQKSLDVTNKVSSNYAVMISPMHLDTLIGNIIGNAVKYSYIEGKLEFDGKDSLDSVTLTFRDYGVGIEKENIHRIFDGFYRADHSRHERESHGLGLTIAKRVVDLYGGNIWAESEGQGKGTTFYLRLLKNPPINYLPDAHPENEH